MKTVNDMFGLWGRRSNHGLGSNPKSDIGNNSMKLSSKLKAMSLGLILATGVAGAQAAFASNHNTFRYAVEAPGVESMMFWRTPGNFPMPHMQFLVGQDAETGEWDDSGLARSWEHNDDFTEWTFHLHENAEWHYDWGPVTAEDVVHSLELGTGDDAILSGLERINHATAEAVDDHTVRFHLGRPEVEFLFAHGLRGAMQIYSKAQYDAEGLDGYRNQPAGTGQFKLVDYNEGQGARFQAVENHWSGDSAQVDYLEFVFVDEPATRFAMVASGDVDATNLPRELQVAAQGMGLDVIESTNIAMQTTWLFWGAYIDHPTDLAWQNREIRKAAALSINWDDLNAIVYDGLAERIPKFGMHEPNEGWNQDLVERFDENYGYDPERAREILDEIGYPENFDNPAIPVLSTTLAGNPEFPTLAEYIESAFSAVGLQADIREMAYARHNELRRTFDTDYTMPMRNLPVRVTEAFVSTFYSEDASPVHTYSSEEFEAVYQEYRVTFNADERDRLAQELFQIAFDDYATIPLAGITFNVVVNPNSVSDWVFPGASSVGVSHWQNIVPAN